MLHSTLRALGIASWIGCILVLAYQSLSWMLNAAWPSITTLDATQALLGIDLTSLIQNLTLEYAVKMIYLLLTTELSIALWWTGVFFFALTFIGKIIFGK